MVYFFVLATLLNDTTFSLSNVAGQSLDQMIYMDVYSWKSRRGRWRERVYSWMDAPKIIMCLIFILGKQCH